MSAIEAGADHPHAVPLAIAQALVVSAIALARAEGFLAAAAVVDAGGHLLAFARDDGAPFLPGDVATLKARTAAASEMPTDRWTAMLADAAVAPIAQLPGMMAVPGGLPLHRGGTVIGALGVSGSHPDRDNQVARAAIATVAPEWTSAD